MVVCRRVHFIFSHCCGVDRFDCRKQKTRLGLQRPDAWMKTARKRERLALEQLTGELNVLVLKKVHCDAVSTTPSGEAKEKSKSSLASGSRGSLCALDPRCSSCVVLQIIEFISCGAGV
jgi:hypothetical protein